MILSEAVCVLGGRIYGSVGKDRTDCVRLTADVLSEVYGEPVRRERPALLIHAGQGPWSPVEGIVRAGAGVEVSAPLPGRWHLCQGWRRLTDDGGVPKSDGRYNGHGWLWYEPETPTGALPLIVQATTAPAPWCHRTTWDKQVNKFPAGVRLAVLNEV